MPGRLFCLFGAAALLLAAGETRAAGNALKITYIANEGFLLEHGGKKVLIDALFSGQNKPYADFPSPDLVSAMEQARPPFDSVDLVLATHSHDDHFSAKSVAAHLAHNPRAVFLSTGDAVEQVRQISPDLGATGRIRAVCPERMHTSRTEEVAGIRIDVLRVDHGLPNFENLAFAIRWNGVSVLHTGDSDPDGYRSFKWDDTGLDVVFANPGYFQPPIENGVNLFKNVVRARNVVFMHHRKSQVEDLRRLATELRPHFNQVIVFSEPMQTAEPSLTRTAEMK